MNRKSSVGWPTLVISVFVLGIGLARPADVGAQQSTISTNLGFLGNRGAIGTLGPGESEVAFEVFPGTRALVTDIIFSNAGDVSTCGQLFNADPVNDTVLGARTLPMTVPAEDTVDVSLATGIGFTGGSVKPLVQNCSNNNTQLEYQLRAVTIE